MDSTAFTIDDSWFLITKGDEQRVPDCPVDKSHYLQMTILEPVICFPLQCVVL